MSEAALPQAFRQFVALAPALDHPRDILIALDRVAESVGVHTIGIWPQLRVYGEWDEWNDHTVHLHPDVPDEFLPGVLAGVREHGGSVSGMLLRTRLQPFGLIETQRQMRLRGPQLWMHEHYDRFGYHDALLCPLPHFASSFWSHAELALSEHARCLLQEAAVVAAQRIRSLMKKHRAGSSMPTLTPRQKQIAMALALSRSVRQIAKELEISERAVQHHIDAMAQKLGIDNNPGGGIVYKLMQHKIIAILGGLWMTCVLLGMGELCPIHHVH